MAKVTVFAYPISSFIFRYQEGDEDISVVRYTGDLVTAKKRLKEHLEQLIKELDTIKLKGIE